MLVQLPRHSQPAQGSKSKKTPQGDRPSFEAGLRRDLASLHVVAYDAIIGGVGKRAGDLAFATLTAPIWGATLIVAIFLFKKHVPGRVFVCDERTGYGGRVYKCWRLQTTPPSAEIVALHPPAPEAESHAQASGRGHITWNDLIERLPEMINVLSGDMSFVGPRPISREEFEDLRGGRKYYASARPGFVSASDCGPVEEPQSLLYKYYAMNWSPLLDLRIIFHALRRFKLSRND